MTRRHLLAAACSLPLQASKIDRQHVAAILAALPLYGSFDLLSLRLKTEGLTLGGYAARATFKDDAEAALRNLNGVGKIENQIEALPVSATDDAIRWATFRAIYRDPDLGRYAPGGENFGGPFQRSAGGIFFGAAVEAEANKDPIGAYPIHILVKNSSVILVGVVASKADSTRANLLANGIAGVSNVKNLLESDPLQFTRRRK